MKLKNRRQSSNIEDARTPEGKTRSEAKTKLLTRFLQKSDTLFAPMKKGLRIMKKTPIERQSKPDKNTREANAATQKLARKKKPVKLASKMMNAPINAKPSKFQ